MQRSDSMVHLLHYVRTVATPSEAMTVEIPGLLPLVPNKCSLRDGS